MPRSAFVQTAARTKSCVIECGGHVIPLFQSRFQKFHPLRVGILSWRNAHHPAERPIQLGRAHPVARTEFWQGQTKIAALCAIRGPVSASYLFINFAAYSGDGVRLCILDAIELWFTSFTGAEAFLFGCSRKRKKVNLFASGFARGTRRFAINSGRAHRVDERAVGALVAILYRSPARVRRLGRTARVTARVLLKTCSEIFRHMFDSSSVSFLLGLHAQKIALPTSHNYPFLAPKFCENWLRFRLWKSAKIAPVGP